MEALAKLERVQTRLLKRLSNLESSLLSQHFSQNLSLSTSSTTEDRLSGTLRANGVVDFSFKRVPSDYYDWPLKSHRDIVSVASIQHLCKSIVLVNTQAASNIIDCSDRNNSKYYVVVVQYAARFNAESVKNFPYTLNESKIAKKKFNMRLAPEETSVKLIGYEHNAVTCIGMKTNIPVPGLPHLDGKWTNWYVFYSPSFFFINGLYAIHCASCAASHCS
uniref:Uncharacterized protein isoform X2 n=1 Tax=Nicotiana tabacum TaxID=4097 RepID=A0A1S4BIS8_TOBAC|nr:PREDICTED: uncharacterized protein LOC107808727 isoform X2 [Nicotiana tabacum]